MRELKIIALLTLVVIGPAAVKVAVGQQQAQPLGIEEVKDGLYIITGSGGNVAARVTPAGVILIDDKFDRNHGEIMQRVAGVTNQPITYVLGTHHHGDHMGGNPPMSRHAQIIAHRNARVNMINGEQPSPPNIVFNDQTSVFLGDVEVQMHHLGRGHTDGDSVIATSPQN